jgi:ABC-2 type transport system ATP-binding protein
MSRAHFTSAEVIASFKNVKKIYGQVAAVNDCSFSLCSGEIVALLGLNGAGKTTVVRLLLGLASPTQGDIRIFGGIPGDRQVRLRVAAMLQVGGVPSTLRVREHIAQFRSYYSHPLSSDEVLKIAGLKEVKNQFYGNLSGGQKQRVLFAIALCGDPDLLILDEPTASLDIEGRHALWEQIRCLPELGKTVLFTTHHLEEADTLSSRILVLQKGQIVANGTPSQIKASQQVRSVRCRTTIDSAVIETIPTVTGVQMDGSSIIISAGDVELVARELLYLDPNLRDLEIQNIALEQAFLAISRSGAPSE